MTICRYTPDKAALWDEFVGRSRQGTFLFERAYMDYHQDRFADHSLMVYRKARLFALLPANATDGVLWSHQGLTYGGLLTGPEATVEDVVRHILHAMEVAGEDHVGIGSDFDGDGGVKGVASAAEMMNLTRLLLQAGVTEAQLEKLWGGNFLRVMKKAQDYAKEV